MIKEFFLSGLLATSQAVDLETIVRRDAIVDDSRETVVNMFDEFPSSDLTIDNLPTDQLRSLVKDLCANAYSNFRSEYFAQSEAGADVNYIAMLRSHRENYVNNLKKMLISATGSQRKVIGGYIAAAALQFRDTRYSLKEEARRAKDISLSNYNLLLEVPDSYSISKASVVSSKYAGLAVGFLSLIGIGVLTVTGRKKDDLDEVLEAVETFDDLNKGDSEEPVVSVSMERLLSGDAEDIVSADNAGLYLDAESTGTLFTPDNDSGSHRLEEHVVFDQGYEAVVPAPDTTTVWDDAEETPPTFGGGDNSRSGVTLERELPATIPREVTMQTRRSRLAYAVGGLLLGSAVICGIGVTATDAFNYLFSGDEIAVEVSGSSPVLTLPMDTSNAKEEFSYQAPANIDEGYDTQYNPSVQQSPTYAIDWMPKQQPTIDGKVDLDHAWFQFKKAVEKEGIFEYELGSSLLSEYHIMRLGLDKDGDGIADKVKYIDVSASGKIDLNGYSVVHAGVGIKHDTGFIYNSSVSITNGTITLIDNEERNEFLYSVTV